MIEDLRHNIPKTINRIIQHCSVRFRLAQQFKLYFRLSCLRPNNPLRLFYVVAD